MLELREGGSLERMMIVVLESPEHMNALCSEIGEVPAVPFLRAVPPLVMLPEADGALAERIASIPGIARVFTPKTPLLSTHALHAEKAIVRVGNVEFGRTDIPVIAGPCSVEDEAQMVSLAHKVKERGARLLRGGAYKGRTSPFAFQGHGEDALPHLVKAREKTQLPLVTEIITPEDVDLLAGTVDLLQVGARNMHNTALLKALGRTQVPVLLKRGFGSSVEELLFAADYILAEGNPNVMLCERGIRTFERGVRFSFDLSAFALLKSQTRLPVIVDPSHAVGHAGLVSTVAKAALAAGADGLLIEVHDAPEEALSDGEQALTPDVFASLMDELSPIAKAVGRQLAGVLR